MTVLVVYISHIINSQLIKNFLSIKEAISNFENYNIVWCNPNNKIINDELNDYIINLNISDEDLRDKNNENVINGHLHYLGVYNRFPNYDYYWYIENDVIINNENQKDGWINLFSFYQNSLEDFICSKINKWKDYRYYQLRYPIYSLQKYFNNPFVNINIDMLYFGFLPVCRMSNRFLQIIKKYYQSENGYLEWVIPSLAKYYNMSICSLSDDKFDIDESNYTNDNLSYNYWEINQGSISWEPKKDDSYKTQYPKNTIIHPVKYI